MPRPRTPLAKAALTGADKINPGRFSPRKEPKKSGRMVGKPPGYLSDMAQKAWGVFVDELPWLTFEDRGALEVVSLMRAEIMAANTEKLSASFFGNYRMALSSLGATPVDRTKVYQPPPDDEGDEFDRFVQ